MDLTLKPIGFFHSQKNHPFEAAHQGVLDHAEEIGFIELNSGENFEQALSDLNQFSHIWIIYQFDRNENWKPMVLPPRGTTQKKGVFATRSPYRPNPIGMSAVSLNRIDGLKIYVTNFDLLNGTPILDIKPYLPYSDSFPEASMGWLKDLESFSIGFSELANEQLAFLYSLEIVGFKTFLLNQLEYEPTNKKKKRVRALETSEGHNKNKFEIAYRTWRAVFEIEQNKIIIQKIQSGYSPQNMQDLNDPYRDKSKHKSFLHRYKAD